MPYNLSSKYVKIADDLLSGRNIVYKNVQIISDRQLTTLTIDGNLLIFINSRGIYASYQRQLTKTQINIINAVLQQIALALDTIIPYIEKRNYGVFLVAPNAPAKQVNKKTWLMSAMVYVSNGLVTIHGRKTHETLA